VPAPAWTPIAADAAALDGLETLMRDKVKGGIGAVDAAFIATVREASNPYLIQSLSNPIPI